MRHETKNGMYLPGIEGTPLDSQFDNLWIIDKPFEIPEDKPYSTPFEETPIRLPGYLPGPEKFDPGKHMPYYFPKPIPGPLRAWC